MKDTKLTRQAGRHRSFWSKQLILCFIDRMVTKNAVGYLENLCVDTRMCVRMYAKDVVRNNFGMAIIL